MTEVLAYRRMGLVMTLAKRLYELQQIDLEIQDKRGALDEFNRQLGENEVLLRAKSELACAEQHLSEINKQQRDIEWEIEDLQNKSAQLNEKIYGGKVKNPKELLSLEHEMHTFKVSLGQKEDALLDLMTEAEANQGEVHLNTERLKKLDEEWQKEQGIISRKHTDVEKQLFELGERRQTLASQIDSQSINLYEGVKLRRGQAVAKVEQGKCQGCHISLPMIQWQRARAGTLVQCSSCGRILYIS